MKKIWLRAHAIERLIQYAWMIGAKEQAFELIAAFAKTDGEDEMTTIEVDDRIAEFFTRDEYLFIRGQVIA